MATLAMRRTEAHKPELTATEWAYLAGIVDGEGTISIVRVLKHGRKGQPHHILQPILGVTNTNQELLTWLGQKIGTRVDSRSRPQVIGENHLKRPPAVCYQVQLWGYQVYHVLRPIQPYLVAKQQQARLVLGFLESRLTQSESRYNPPYSLLELNLWQQVRGLNWHGSTPYPDEVALIRMSTT